MPKKNCDVARRAWNVLRLALLWARKGGIFKRTRLMMELRMVPKYLRRLGHTVPRDQIHYGERELSFDETPMFQAKMHRPNSMWFLFPCISAEEVDFDYDFGVDDDNDDGVYGDYDTGRKSFIKCVADDDNDGGEEEEKIPLEEEGIDSRAEAFIAKFYEQIKLQRQISYLQYTEMLNRGAN